MISVIIPTWNEAKSLPALLTQLQQEPEVGEMIVADAQSTDETCAIATSFGARVVDGGMPGVGRNAGASVAKGDWLLFLDADSQLIGSHWCERALSEMNRRRLALTSAAVWPLSPASWLDWFFHGVYTLYMHSMAHIVPHVTGACLLVRADVFRASGGFRADVAFAEDVEWAGRVAREHRFGILRRVAIATSIRRLNAEGRWRFAKKYLQAEYAILRGHIPTIDYSMKNPRV